MIVNYFSSLYIGRLAKEQDQYIVTNSESAIIALDEYVTNNADCLYRTSVEKHWIKNNSKRGQQDRTGPQKPLLRPTSKHWTKKNHDLN
jgi:hypothetical protein